MEIAQQEQVCLDGLGGQRWRSESAARGLTPIDVPPARHAAKSGVLVLFDQAIGLVANVVQRFDTLLDQWRASARSVAVPPIRVFTSSRALVDGLQCSRPFFRERNAELRGGMNSRNPLGTL